MADSSRNISDSSSSPLTLQSLETFSAPCLELQTRSCPGRLKTHATVSSLAASAYYTASRYVTKSPVNPVPRVTHSYFSPQCQSSSPFAYTQTDTNAHGQSVTTLWKAIRANKEDRVAKLEWAPNGGLGRAVIGKVIFCIDQILEDIVTVVFRARCLWPTSSA